MSAREVHTEALPVLEERLRVGKRTVETGRVRISIKVRKRKQPIREQLVREEIAVERKRIDRFVDDEPSTRREGDVLVVPVFEEVLVKRILLREELRISRKRRVTPMEDHVTLKRQDVVVDRQTGPKQPK